MSRFIGIPCGAPASTPPVNALAVTYSQARQQLQSVRSRLSHSIKDYLAACQLMDVIYNASDTPPDERAKTLLAIDSELATFPVEETNLRQARSALVGTQNRSTMIAPVYKLPSEILARIFSAAACHCPDYLMVHELVPPILNPISICGVCREWRRVALGYLPLWTHIDLVVGRRDSGHKYPSPEIWTESSYGTSLYVNIRQYRSLHKGENERGDDRNLPLYDHKYSPAPMVARLEEFLLPLMPQICAMTLVLCSSVEYLPDRLLGLWSRYCTTGRAKIFSVQSKRDLPTVKIEGLGLDLARASRNRHFLESLEELGFHNAIPQGWYNWSFGNLVSLLLDVGGHVPCYITQTKLASVLTSCSRLQRLTINNLHVERSNGSAPNPATLSELRLLDLDAYNVGQMIESVLAIINPGPSGLCMSISMPHHSESPHPVFDAVQSFIIRHNVTTLHVDHRGCGPYFASQLGPLPRVKTLVLKHCYVSGVAWVDYHIRLNRSAAFTNPSPVDLRPVLWPDLQNLYLHECALEKNHLRRLLLPHSIQSLYIRKCYDGHAFRPEMRMESPESEEFARSLSEIIPKTVHFKDGWNRWPIPSSWESW